MATFGAAQRKSIKPSQPAAGLARLFFFFPLLSSALPQPNRKILNENPSFLYPPPWQVLASSNHGPLLTFLLPHSNPSKLPGSSVCSPNLFSFFSFFFKKKNIVLTFPLHEFAAAAGRPHRAAPEAPWAAPGLRGARAQAWGRARCANVRKMPRRCCLIS